MIPRSIFSIWIGGTPAREILDRCETMRKMNEPHGFRYRIWGDDALERYSHDPYIRFMQQTGEKIAFIVDRLRVLLLRDFGGIYVDADCAPVRPFTVINDVLNAPHVEFVAGLRNPWRPGVNLNRSAIPVVDNTVLMSAPNSPMANSLCRLYSSSSKRVTGADMGREIIRKANFNTVLLGYEYFYIYEEQPTENTILLHDRINSATWCTEKPEVPSMRTVSV